MQIFKFLNPKSFVLFAAAFAMVACSPAADSDLSSNGRILMQNQPLNLQAPQNSSMSAPLALNLNLLFDILPPPATLTNNIQTFAADLRVSGNYAITAYNTVGSPQAGAVDVVNLGILGALPYIDSTKYFADFDVNAVTYDNGAVWAFGAKENLGSHLKKFPVSLGNLQAPTLEVDLAGHAGTGLQASGSHIFTTSGNNAGILILDMTTGAVTATLAINDARDIKVLGNGDLLVISGGSCLASSGANNCDTSVGTKTPAKMVRYTPAGVVVWSTDLTGATIAESKSTLAVGTTYAAASLGDGGLSVVCLADGAIMTNVAQASVNGVAAGLTVTNAVAAIPGMILTADGAAGMTLYQIESSMTGPTSACAKMKLTSLGTTNFNDGSSINNISAGSFNLSLGALGIQIYLGRVYVAAGAKGIRTVELGFTLTALTTILNL